MADAIQFARDSAADWTSNNPTLPAGMAGLETDTGRYKISLDGATAWNSLGYSGGPPRKAMAYLTSNKTGLNRTAASPVSWDSTVYDDGGWWAGGDPTKLSVPSGLNYVEVGANFYVTNVGSGQPTYLSINKNGAGFAGGPVNLQATGTDRRLSVASGPLSVVGGTDYFTAVLGQDTDTSIDLIASLSAFWIREVLG